MKIPKKHAVALADFMDLFLYEGFYPFDPAEEQTTTKVVGFGLYHGLICDQAIDHLVKKVELTLPKKTARLDVCEEDVSILLDMIDELHNQNSAFYGELEGQLKSTVRYLRKEFLSD